MRGEFCGSGLDLVTRVLRVGGWGEEETRGGTEKKCGGGWKRVRRRGGGGRERKWRGGVGGGTRVGHGEKVKLFFSKNFFLRKT